MGEAVRLQVLVCTYGKEGMSRVQEMDPPRVPGVEWLVSWQLPEGHESAVPPALAVRPDLRVHVCRNRGLSRNRNEAMRLATAPWCLLADDDLRYMPGALEALMAEAEARPDTDILCCAYTCCGRFMKPYPVRPVPLRCAPKGWYANSFEIAFRRQSPAGRTLFNENFGAGAPLMRAGEEDLWLHDAARAGAAGMILPLTLCRHDHDSTAERDGSADWFVMTRGAVHSRLHPVSWPLRMLRHSLRQKTMTPWRYLRLALRGARHARRHGYFRQS